MKSFWAGLLALCAQVSAGTLTFEATTKEVDVSFEATSAFVDFTFKNDSGEPVVIDRFDSSCSCLKAAIKGGTVYDPGKGGVIRATMDTTALTGVVDKSLAVWLKGDAPGKPSAMLTMRVKIPELVDVQPKALEWEIGGEKAPKTVTVTMQHSTPIRVLSITGADPRFKQELKVIEEGKKYEVTVTPTAIDAMATGVIRVNTDCTYPRHRSHSVFAVVREKGK